MSETEPENTPTEGAEEEIKEQASEAAPEAKEEAKAEPAPEEKPEEKEAREAKRRGFQQRINELTRRAREADERAASAQSQYEALLKEIKEKPLTREQFATDGEFEAALHARSGRMAAVESRRLTAEEAAASQSAEHRQALDASWNEAVAEVMARIPDWHQVVSSDRGPTTQVMLEQIKESDNGPEVAYYLAKHPGEAQRIAGLSIPAQIREVGRLSARLENGTPTKPTAPPPIKPVTPVAKPETSSTEDYRAYEARRLKELYGR